MRLLTSGRAQAGGGVDLDRDVPSPRPQHPARLHIASDGGGTRGRRGGLLQAIALQVFDDLLQHAFHKLQALVHAVHVAVPGHDVIEAVERFLPDQQPLIGLDGGHRHGTDGEEDYYFVDGGHEGEEAHQDRGHPCSRVERRQDNIRKVRRQNVSAESAPAQYQCVPVRSSEK